MRVTVGWWTLLFTAIACAASGGSSRRTATAPSTRAAPAPGAASAAPRPKPHRELGDAGIPPLSAEPSADGARAEPDWVSRRRTERHDAIDRLLDGKLSEAEARCRTEPVEKREPCIDAILNEHQRVIGERMGRSFHGLELLIAYGDAKCRAVQGPKARQRCSMSASEKLLEELAVHCTTGTDDEQHDCVMQQVIERLEPRPTSPATP